MLLSHCNSSKWHNSKQCGSRKKKPRVQIRVAIKIYSFIHSIHLRKQASKQAKKTITGRPMGRSTDRRRSTTTDRRRPTDRPPTTDRRRPTDRRRSTTTDRPTDRPLTIDDRRRPTADDRRSTTTDRPTIDDRRRTITSDVVFLHFDGLLSMSDGRLSTIDGRK